MQYVLAWRSAEPIQKGSFAADVGGAKLTSVYMNPDHQSGYIVAESLQACLTMTITATTQSGVPFFLSHTWAEDCQYHVALPLVGRTPIE